MQRLKTLFLLIALLASFSFGAAWMGATSKPESTQTIDGKKFYVITTPEELAWFADQVNAGNNSINAVLANDIVFGKDTASVNAKYAWTPIGEDSLHAFRGILDGAGYSIYGVYTDPTIKYGGLVGGLDSAGVVRNVNMKRDSINANKYAGGIVSYNDGGTVSGCTNEGSVSVSSDSYAGGVVGYNGGTVSDCANEGSVSGSTAGGIVCYNYGTVSGCMNSGSVSAAFAMFAYVGGIVCYNYGTVSDCSNSGGVTVSANPESYSMNFSIGGIVGLNSGSEALVKNSYSRTNTLAVDKDCQYSSCNMGGVVGRNMDSAKIINCYYASDVLYDVSTIGENSATLTDVSGMTTANMRRDQFVLILNTTNGSEESSGVWSRDGGYPIIADVGAASSSSGVANSSSSASSSSSGAGSSSSSGSTAFHVTAQPRFNLQVQNRTIWVQNVRMGESFAVFDVQGHLLRRGVVNSTEQSITLQNAGAYIVRVGTETMRVRVK